MLGFSSLRRFADVHTQSLTLAVNAETVRNEFEGNDSGRISKVRKKEPERREIFTHPYASDPRTEDPGTG
jgi:hypothetical protein